MNQSSKKPNKWLALINIPIQMGAIIFLCSYLGNWLDDKYINKHNLFVKTLTLLGVAIAFHNLNRQIQDINSSEK